MKNEKPKAVWLGDVLKSKRKKIGKSQVEIAEFIGITPQSYGEWESGDSKPESPNLALLCLYFDCPSSDFFSIPAKFLSQI